ILFPRKGIFMAELLLTTTEVASLVQLDEKRVRKDVEYGVVAATNPPRFDFATLVYFRAIALLDLTLGLRDRKRLHDLIDRALRQRPVPLTLPISPVVELRLGEIVDETRSKLEHFMVWKKKLVKDDRILGGEEAFPNTRLAVRQIGGMLLRGVAPEEIREDYPYLTEDDLQFAKLFAAAYPRVGRPSERREAHP